MRCSAMTDEPAGRTEAYDYELPAELIAARPAARRDASRLLVLDRARGRFTDAAFPALLERLSAGDAVVVNDSRVFPARLLGRKPTGARAEILLVRPESDALQPFAPFDDFDEADTRLWRAMVRPGGKLKPGRTVDIADGFAVDILDSASDGTRLVRLAGDGDPWSLIQRHGRVPLPPYIVRDTRDTRDTGDTRDDADDRERYQTVYAAPSGSIAAPTAGLHFTREMLATVESRGVRLVALTLHVGFGTFRPVTAERIDEHEVAAEAYSFSSSAAAALNATRAAGGRVFAVGTTSCRVLETVVARAGAGAGGSAPGGRLVGRPLRTGAGGDEPLHPSPLHLPRRGRPRDELPPSPLQPAHARCGIRGPGTHARGLRPRDPRAIPLLFLRRRDGHHMSTIP